MNMELLLFDDKYDAQQFMSRSPLDMLSDDVLGQVFLFLGSGHYRYIAATCHRFRHVYQHTGEQLGKDQTTYWQNAAVSVACAQVCLDDYKEQQHRLHQTTLVKVVNKIVTSAALDGNIPALTWARRNGGRCDWYTFRLAASKGHTRVLQWACSLRLDWNSPAIAYDAAYCGHVEILDFCYQHNRQHFDATGSFAARGGHLHVLEWMKQRSLLHKYNWHVWYEAAHYGHVHVLDWLLEEGYTPDSTVVSGAAKGGHVSILEWARQHNLSIGIKASAHASYHGHLHVLQWLRHYEYAWDGNVLYWARKARHAHVLEWAREHDCPVEMVKIIDVDRYV
jgi:hypothetical protein